MDSEVHLRLFTMDRISLMFFSTLKLDFKQDLNINLDSKLKTSMEKVFPQIQWVLLFAQNQKDLMIFI